LPAYKNKELHEIPNDFKCVLSYKKHLDNAREACEYYKETMGGMPQKFELHFHEAFEAWISRAKTKEKIDRDTKKDSFIIKPFGGDNDEEIMWENFFEFADSELLFNPDKTFKLG